MRIAVAFAICLAALPAAAQNAGDEDDPMGLIERGSRMLLEEFLNRLDPALEDLQREIGPALEALQDQLGRLDAYHPPEILPNGDIILRRKTPIETDPVPEPDTDPAPVPDDGAIEL
ncbi:MAG: hypothetical protein AAGK37_08255 [Pseudomonadota bacterium]